MYPGIFDCILLIPFVVIMLFGVLLYDIIQKDQSHVDSTLVMEKVML